MTSLLTTQAKANAELHGICCRSTDWFFIEAFINANRPYLQLAYRNYACLEELIKTGDPSLCSNLITALGPMHPDHIRALVERASHMGNLRFILDIARDINMPIVLTKLECERILFTVCSRGANVELIERVCALYDGDTAVTGLIASFYSWDQQLLNYFLHKYMQTQTKQVDLALITVTAAISGNTCAFEQVLHHLKVGCGSLLALTCSVADEPKNGLALIMDASASEQTGRMMEILVDYIQSMPVMTMINVGLTLRAKCTARERTEYVDAVSHMCRKGYTDAARLFIQGASFDVEQVRNLVGSIESESVLEAVIEELAVVLDQRVVHALSEYRSEPAVGALLSLRAAGKKVQLG